MIFTAEGARDREQMHAVTKNLAELINTFVPHKCIVHSSIIDPQIKEILNNEKLIFIQKNLADAKIAISTILNLLPIILGDQGREGRTFIRVNLYPEQQIKVQVLLLRPPKPEEVLPELEGVIQDLSIGGMSLIIKKVVNAGNFSLKTPVKLKISLPRAIVRINLAVVVRNKKNGSELGLQFNMLNHKMVDEMNGTVLSGYIFSQLRSLIK